jgi:hypothetical protein
MTGYPRVVWVVFMRYDKVMDFRRVIVFLFSASTKGIMMTTMYYMAMMDWTGLGIDE